MFIDPHDISTEQLMQLGQDDIAYIKPVMVDGSPCFAIHAADGTPLALTKALDVAKMAVQNHDMLAALVH